MRLRHRVGLTRPELLIVVVLALFALGLLVSFIGRGRGLSSRVECAHHLKRLGEAIVLYHDDKARPARGLPPARIADGCATWPIILGPYLARDNPFAEWDLQRSYESQLAAVRETVLPVFLCPARDRGTALSVAGDVDQNGVHLPGGLGDYGCASGDGDPMYPWTGAAANGAIILGEVLEKKGDRIVRWQSRTSLASLKRGIAQTILIGEKHVPWGRFGDAAVGDGSLYNGANPASSARVGGPGFGLAQSVNDPFQTTFGSAHPGICQFLHADGSVTPYANSMDEEILGRLIRRE